MIRVEYKFNLRYSRDDGNEELLFPVLTDYVSSQLHSSKISPLIYRNAEIVTISFYANENGKYIAENIQDYALGLGYNSDTLFV